MTPANLQGLGADAFDLLLSYPASSYPQTFTPGPNSGCSPINPFDPKANNKAGLAFAFPTLTNRGLLTQHDVNGYVRFDLPDFKQWFDKPATMVLGGEYREESSASISPALSTVPSLYFDGGASPVKGSFDVSEAFGEFTVPIFSDRPFAKELTLDMGRPRFELFDCRYG